MADFPINPNIGDTFTAPDGTVWTWDGYSWKASGAFGSGGGGGSLSPWILKTSNYSMNVGDRIIANTSSGTFDLTLPATPNVGNSVMITDGASFLTTPVTVLRNGSTIEGVADDVSLTIAGCTYEFIYTGNTWEVTATTGPAGPQGATGIQGTVGSQGTQGVQGVQGITGTQGVGGIQGTQGVQGLIGIGTQGVQGIEGGVSGDIRKFASQNTQFDVVSDTNFNDSDISIELTAGSYALEFLFGIESHATPDAEWRINYTGTVTSGVGFLARMREGAAYSITDISTVPYSSGLMTTTDTTWHSGAISLVVADSGTLSLQLRQGTSSATAVSIRAGSWFSACPSTANIGAGSQGITGTQGTTGTQGATGTQGTIGAQGTTGTQGATGTQGTDGTQGTQGVQGTQGIQGVQGTQGIQGAGISGSDYVLKAGDTMTGALSFSMSGNNNFMRSAHDSHNFAILFGSSYDSTVNPIIRGYGNTAPSSGNVISYSVPSSGYHLFGVGGERFRVNVAGAVVTGNVYVNSGGGEPDIQLYRPSKNHGVGIGLLRWRGQNASDTPVDYARLQTEISSNTAGAQTGSFQIETAVAGTMSPILTANGANVGIGTVSPASKFHVFQDGNLIFQLQNTDTGSDANTIVAMGYHHAGFYGYRIRNRNYPSAYAAGNLVFERGTTATWEPVMDFDNTGKATFHNGQVWSETVPGTDRGTIHLDPNGSTDHQGGAITFGASDSTDGTLAQAGIYTRSDGSYGTKMYFATTDNYTIGSKIRMSIMHNGNVGIGAGATTAPASVVHVDDGAWSRLHLAYQGSTNYMDADNQYFRKYNGTTQMSLGSDTHIEHLGGIYNAAGGGGTAVARVLHPKGGVRGSQTSSEVGYIRIRIPASNSDTMLAFTVHIFDYAGGAEGSHRTIRIQGYNYSSGWANYGAYEIHSNGGVAPLRVRFGHDGTNNIVWIGESGTAWSYPQIMISDVMAGYYGIDSRWASGWNVAIDASLGGTVSAGPIYANKAIVTNYSNSAFLEPNDSSSYAAWRMTGNKNGYGGLYEAYSGVNMMWDSGGNGGEYRESNSKWRTYWATTNDCLGIGNSTTSSSYELYVSGAIYATGDIVAYSDARKKENIYTIDNALDKVCRMRGVYYNRKDDPEKRRNTGVIAQEINEVLPEVVTHANTSNDKGETSEEYGVNYGHIVGVLIEAIKELKVEIDELKKRNR